MGGCSLKKIIICTLFFCALLCNGASASETENKGYIVKLKEQSASFSAMSLPYQRLGTDVYAVDREQLDNLLETNRVLCVEEDIAINLFDQPNDYYYPSQWYLEEIQADFSLSLNLKGQQARIGVIDSGVNREHEDLTGAKIITKNYTPISDNDDVGHGTSVIGVIAAQPDNGTGIVGIAPKCEIVSLKCFYGATGQTMLSYLIQAVYDAIDVYGCKVINMSFGMTTDSTFFHEALMYAESKGVICVAAVGNYGNEKIYYPAAYDSVIGVGGVAKSDGRIVYSETSQYNESVFLTAPGNSIMTLSHANHDGYKSVTGTSFAAPQVSAFAALVSTLNPNISPEQFRDLLRLTCADIGDIGWDKYYGYGVLNIQSGILDLNISEILLVYGEKNEKSAYLVLYNPSEQLKEVIIIVSKYTDNYTLDDVHLYERKLQYGITEIEYPIFENGINRIYIFKDMLSLVPVSKSI